MKPSQKAVDLIKQFEGFRANAYLCPANVPTIGYGFALAPGPRCEGPPTCRTCGGCGMVVEEVDDV